MHASSLFIRLRVEIKRHTLSVVVKRTSLNLDLDLVAEAKQVLDTRETTQTIHRALEEVVRQARLRRLLAHRFEMTNEELKQLRTPDVETLPLLPEP